MKKLFIAFPIIILLLCPLAVSAQSDPFFGPIVPDASTLGDACKSGDPLGFGALLETARNLMNFGIGIATIIATLIIVWAGFLFVTSATNPESRSTAKKLLVNALGGMLIVLSAWLIVDFIMKRLYVGEDGQSGQFGPWNSVLTGGDACIKKDASKPLFEGGIIGGFGVGPAVNPGTGGTGTPTSPAAGTGANCPAGNPSSMVAFPAAATSGETEKATATTVQNFLAMRAAALKDGVDLKVTDGYRSDAEQVQLWNQYGHDTSQVAKPCSLGGGGSNHNSGTAVDIAVGCAKKDSACKSPAFLWLKAHGAQWNFRNALPTDVVHWSPSGR